MTDGTATARAAASLSCLADALAARDIGAPLSPSSLYVALQLKARMEGIPTPVYGAPDGLGVAGAD
jgi:hypothetical protein